MALIPGISRRRFLSTAGQLAAVTALGSFGAQAWAAQGARRLTAGTRTIEVQGRAATVFGLTDERGRQGLTLDIADGFDVALANEAGVPTVIHWHGLTPPFGQDGNTLSQEPIPAGGTKNFAFDLPRGGTNWMHSHFGLQEAQLMAAPLILRDGAADRQEVVMLLHDFSFTSPEELMARLVGDDAGRIGSGMAAMQHGMVRGPSQDGTGMAGMDPSGMEGM
ncbi:multicopper oxidase domain-containing protein, partial [Paracoccus sp. UBA889]